MEKKKINILTFHCAHNVGAMLQCYALSNHIKALGYEVEVIDYRPEKIREEAIENYLKASVFQRIIRESEELVYYIYRTIKYLPQGGKRIYITKGTTVSGFSKFFKNYLPLSKTTYYTEKELGTFERCNETFITGSDQVWNPLLSNTPKTYLLDFVKNGSKNSYAASFGKNVLDKTYESVFSDCLKTFDSISVREKSGVSIVNKITDKEATQVLDPVFLLNKQEWKKLAYKIRLKEPYIFIYRMERNENLIELVKQIKNENSNLKTFVFDDINDELEVDYRTPKASPLDFISFLFSSRFVVTNSFHGMAFSLIAEKEAYVFPHSLYNERIESLSQLIGANQKNGYYKIDSNSGIGMCDEIRKSNEILKKICNN